MIRKWLSALLVTVLLLNILPAGAVSPKNVEKIHYVHINPEYADVISVADVQQPIPHVENNLHAETEYLSVEEAGAIVREAMKKRETAVTVAFYTTESNQDTASWSPFKAAMVHTGVPTEGDYLQTIYSTCNASGSLGSGYVNGVFVYKYQLTYTISYKTTAEQEAELDVAVENLLASLDLGDGDDYSKFMAVYNYICENITYDHDNLNNKSYMLKYTAYAALINKTAVCQGYATLLYRLMLELGIDCRYISGDSGGSHGWNIVQIDGLYYNVDSTWDAGETEYSWCLLNDANFTNHVRDEEYRTNAFYTAYPMGIHNYDPNGDNEGAYAAGVCGNNLTWVLTEDGVLTISGTGAMYHYGYYGNGESAPWSAYAAQITELVFASGVTSIGHEAFAGCTALTDLDLPTGVTSVGYRAFAGCTGLQSLTVRSNSKWRSVYQDAFVDCTNLKDVYISSSIILVSAEASWWEKTCLLDYAERIYALSSITDVSDVIRWDYACANPMQTVTVDGVSYVMYTKGTHQFAVTVIDPSCTEKGKTMDCCVHCGYGTVEYSEALGHDLIAHEGKAPTCTEGGWEAYETCSRCDYSSYVELPATHTYDPVVTEPTCTEKGYTTYTCSCGDSYVGDFVEALGHDLIAHEGKAPTSTESGWEAYETCSRCDYSSYVELPAIGHTYDAVVTEPTCTEKGYTTYTCSCGDSYVGDFVEALGHDLIAHEGKTPTCTEGGWEGYETCSRCDYSSYVELPAIGHTYDAVVTDPTCTEGGYTTHTCGTCGDSYTDSHVAALGHKHEAVVTEPTCTEPGYTTYTCHCGDTYTEEIPALGHSFVDGTCERCGAPEVELGDVNGDGKVNARDARALLRYIAGLVDGSEIEYAAADYNNDGKVNARDARAILRSIAGLE